MRKPTKVVMAKVKYLDLSARCTGFGSASVHNYAGLVPFLQASSALGGVKSGRCRVPGRHLAIHEHYVLTSLRIILDLINNTAC